METRTPRTDSADLHITHHEVFRRPGAFAGWPANYGLWAWGQEVVSVFAVGKMGERGEIHELDRHHPFVPRQARSLDGGRTWVAEEFAGRVPAGLSLSADEHLGVGLRIRPRLELQAELLELERPIDFLDPETIVMCARTGLSADSVSWFYVSRSRGRRWDGPFAFHGLDLPIAARTDIVPLGRSDALLMLTTAKSDGSEGRVFCARTNDGGRSFEFLSFVGDEPQGHRIMPSSVMTADGEIVTAVRCKGAADDHGWIELFRSTDEGRNWTCLGVAAGNTGDGGNPPALWRQDGGRLVLVYGHRNPPFGIRMRMSDDGGRSWRAEQMLREDGGTPDLGYPRIVRTTGEELLVVYYFNDGERRERYIAATSVKLPFSGTAGDAR